jgi:ribonuclease HII
MLSVRFKDDNMIEIGIDEAGRGSFWGPIVAGAMIIPSQSSWTEKQQILFSQLRDSKKIRPKKREQLANQIKELLPKCSIGLVTAQEINNNGITWANIEAFRRAISTLSLTEEEQEKTRIIIDGVIHIDDYKGEQELVIEGDSKYLAIAGASILAKVEHDRWITNYCEENPICNDHYDLLKCKGYGTVKHREGIKNNGAHEHHRSLYIQNWLPGSTYQAKSKKKKDTNQCLINFRTGLK